MGWGLISSGSSPIPPSFSSPTKPSSESWAEGEIVERNFSLCATEGPCLHVLCKVIVNAFNRVVCKSCTQSFTSPSPSLFTQLSGPYELGTHLFVLVVVCVLCLCHFLCDSPQAYQEDTLTHLILVGFHFWQHCTTLKQQLLSDAPCAPYVKLTQNQNSHFSTKCRLSKVIFTV